MNLKNYMLGVAAVGLICSSAVNAQAIKKVDVVELLTVVGPVTIERIDGSQYPAQKGALIAHGSKMLMLQGSEVKAKYLKNKCEITYKQNRVVNIRQDKQCSAGVAVLNANQYAKFGKGANPGCCVVKTVTVPSAVIPTAPTTVATTGIAGTSLLAGANTPAIIGGLAALGIAGVIIANNDDDDDTMVDPNMSRQN